jgi:hypothetical protein
MKLVTYEIFLKTEVIFVYTLIFHPHPGRKTPDVPPASTVAGYFKKYGIYDSE